MTRGALTVRYPHVEALRAERRVLDARSDVPGDAPHFVEVGEAGIAVDDAMRRQRCLQLVG